jgi:hypothetical protein|tara:strand:- start:3416 stop:3724 length:309 start_codon:yes stop_codon:yes gene_type:complete
LTADGEGQGDCASAADLDAAGSDSPHCDVTLNFAHAGLLALAICLRGNGGDPVVLVEASHPASAACTETSIAVKDERHALRASIRKLPEVDAVHVDSVPAVD